MWPGVLLTLLGGQMPPALCQWSRGALQMWIIIASCRGKQGKQACPPALASVPLQNEHFQMLGAWRGQCRGRPSVDLALGRRIGQVHNCTWWLALQEIVSSASQMHWRAPLSTFNMNPTRGADLLATLGVPIATDIDVAIPMMLK